MAMQTIINDTVAGPILVNSLSGTLSDLTQNQVRSAMNQGMIQAELNQREGTPLELTVPNFPSVSHAVSHLNKQYHAGTLKDAGTGTPIVAWPGASNVAYAQGSTLILRWRKAQPFLVPLIWGAIIAIAAYLVIQVLRSQSTHWSLTRIRPTSSSTSSGPLGIPWWEWIVGGAAVFVGGPILYHEYDRWIVAHGQTQKDLSKYGPL